jgi:hypothetical protein
MVFRLLLVIHTLGPAVRVITQLLGFHPVENVIRVNLMKK